MQAAKARYLAGFFILGMLLGGCAGLAPQTEALRQQPPAGLSSRAEIPGVPFFPQDDYYCGPASLAMVLNATGARVTAEGLAKQVYLPARKGSLQVEMLASARRNGRVAYQLEPSMEALLREVSAGSPVIVLENYGALMFPRWHYSVVLGYDLADDTIIRHNGDRAHDRSDLRLFEFFWQKEGRWAMVAMPPERVPVTATEPRYAEAVVALEKTGHTRSARTAYEALLKRWPGNLAGLMGAGNTSYALGETEAAESWFRQAVKTHPDSVPAHNNLAQTLLARGRLDEARAAAERAVGLGGALAARARATLDEINRRQSIQKNP